ncbi:cation:proton antiporter [Cryobacterium sp. SO2]|nr:cation:proton antiporter [Cryobacterium sp. SO2]WEO79386.1 cation:proton antiporter [Cryobacterium sp. SO2]
MSFGTLALIGLVALLGPLLAAPRRWRLPVVLGEILGGILLGSSGLGLLQADDPAFAFLASMGFALTMFVAGSHIPIRNASLRPALIRGVLRAILVGAVAALLGVGIAALAGTDNAALYAVLMASSSAALVVPTFAELGLDGPMVLTTLAQVAIADTACIVALPLVLRPKDAPGAMLGAVVIIGCAGVIYLGLLILDRRGLWQRFRRLSHDRYLALELRISLIVLFSLAAVAVGSRGSVMLAGFAFGVAVAAVGEPRRLARQLFALNDGFLGPLFFVWLGASLTLGDLAGHPQFLLLGPLLGAGAVLAHLSMRLTGQPPSLGVMSAAQLGVPVAAVAIGGGVLAPGESTALLIGALVTVVALAVAAAGAARRAAAAPGGAP